MIYEKGVYLLTQPSFNALESSNFAAGIVMGILSAILIAIVILAAKKLNSQNVHPLTVTSVNSFFGVPICAILTLIFELTDNSQHINSFAFVSTPTLLWQIVYLILGAISAIANQILVAFSLIHGDPSKTTVLYAIELLFVFLFQYVLIGIGMDWKEAIGAILIIAGSFLIALFKMIDPKKIDLIANSNIIGKILFFKF